MLRDRQEALSTVRTWGLATCVPLVGQVSQLEQTAGKVTENVILLFYTPHRYSEISDMASHVGNSAFQLYTQERQFYMRLLLASSLLGRRKRKQSRSKG